MHVTSESPILYFGTPVVLISTLNEDGSANLAPVSSVWWLGWRAVLGPGTRSQTTENMQRTHQCVLNLPGQQQVGAVDALARTTGMDPVPPGKVRRGYTTLRDKFGAAGLTPVSSEVVQPPRVAECPVQMEATVTELTPIAADDATHAGFARIVQVGVERLHLDETILLAGDPDRVDPDRWRPLIMSFAEFYGLSPHKLRHSELATIGQDTYTRSGAHAARNGSTTT